MKLRRIGAVALILLGLAVLAALAPYWPCGRCESSGSVHHVDGALMAPSDYRDFRRFVTPKVDRVEPCPHCDGRGRCAGWRSLSRLGS